MDEIQKIYYIFLINCYPNSLSDGFVEKFGIILATAAILDSIKHIFLIKLNGINPGVHKNYANQLKDFIYLSRRVDEFIEIKERTELSESDLKILKTLIPNASQKAAFKINFSLIPQFCLVIIYIYPPQINCLFVIGIKINDRTNYENY